MQRQPPRSDKIGARDDERGVSEVIGAILLFALLFLVIVIVQATAVPAANQQVEFDHSQRVSQDVQALGEAADRVAATGRSESVAIELGATYPPRFFLVNPPPATGYLESRGSATIRIENARAAEPETADYLNGSTITVDTQSYRYHADYDQYDSAPTIVYEGAVLYNDNPEGQPTVIDGGAVVSDDRITLVSLVGDLSKAGVDPEAIELQPVSAPSQRVTVTNHTGNVTLRIPTTLPAAEWRTILRDENVSVGGHVQRVDYVERPNQPYDLVVIELEPGIDYQLRIARVGIGDDLDGTPAHYLAAPKGTETTVRPGASTTLTVEVRDELNNVKAGTEVTFRVTSGNGVFGNGQKEITVASADDGEATVTFRPETAASGTVRVVASAELGDANAKVDEYERVEFVTTVDTEDPETPDYVDQGTESGIEVQSITTAENGKVVTVTFANNGTSTRTLEAVRMPIYYFWSPAQPQQGQADRARPETFTIGTYLTTKTEITGPRQNLTQFVDWAPGETKTLQFRFWRGTNNVIVVTSDFYVVRFYFSDGTISTYYIQVPA